MKKYEKVSDFTYKYSRIVFKLRQLSERIEDKELVNEFLQSMPLRYDSLTLSLEQFGDLDGMQLVDALGSLNVNKRRLSERNVREEDQALLTRTMSKLSYETTKRVSKLK